VDAKRTQRIFNKEELKEEGHLKVNNIINMNKEIDKTIEEIYSMMCRGYNQDTDKYTPEELIGELEEIVENTKVLNNKQ
jgi:deoxyhypusine synthase